MGTPSSATAAPLMPAQGAERRCASRLAQSFATCVRGVTAAGHAFELHTTLENISGGGLYVLLPEPVQVGARLFLVVRLAAKGCMRETRVAVRGTVVRVEPHASGGYGVAVAVRRHRFLSAPTHA